MKILVLAESFHQTREIFWKRDESRQSSQRAPLHTQFYQMLAWPGRDSVRVRMMGTGTQGKPGHQEGKRCGVPVTGTPSQRPSMPGCTIRYRPSETPPEGHPRPDT